MPASLHLWGRSEYWVKRNLPLVQHGVGVVGDGSRVEWKEAGRLPPQPQTSDFISEPQFSHLQSGDNDSYFTELSGGWHTLAGEAPGTPCRSRQAEAPEMSSGYTWGRTIEGLPSDHARNLRARDDLCHKEWGVCPRSTPTFWLGVKDDRVTPVTPRPLVGGAGLGPRPHLQLVAGAFKKLQGKKGDAS